MKTLFIIVPLVLFVTGCQSPNTPPPQETVKAPDLPAQPMEISSGAKPSTLSYGMVTGRVKRGVTTQQEIIDLFGGPSTMTTDKDGVEIWMYDKTTSTVSGNYSQSGSQASQSEASVMAGYLGILLAGIDGAHAKDNSQSAQVGQASQTVTHSIKTITFIIKFNADKTVKDYAVRQSSY